MYLDFPDDVREPQISDEVFEYEELPSLMENSGYTRCILAMRHAQRPPLNPTDATSGHSLPLTEQGEKDAELCGKKLASLPDLSFAASPMRRTILTAQILARAVGEDVTRIQITEEAGMYGVYTLDAERVHKHYFTHSSSEVADMWLNGGGCCGYTPIGKGSRIFFRWLTAHDFGTRNAVLVTHDVFIAAALNGLGIRHITPDNWVGFLHSAVFLQDRQGLWTAAYCVPDKTDFHSTYYQ